MSKKKDQNLDIIRIKAEQEAAQLAGEFARSASEEREAIMAGLEFEKWLAQSCGECLDDSYPIK